MLQTTSHSRYVVLDGMRGIAAIAVMLVHFTSQTDIRYFPAAPAAVDLFFMLSGFVLAFSYGRQVGEGTLSFTQFLLKRVVRLHPMYFLGLVLGTVALYFLHRYGHATYSKHEIVSALGLNTFYLPFFNEGIRHWFERNTDTAGSIVPANGPAWSLLFEMFANLFFFFLIAQPRKTLGRIVLASLFMMVYIGALMAFSDYSWTVTGDAGWGTHYFLGGFPRVFFGFTLGILLQKIIPVSGASDVKFIETIKQKSAFLRRQPFILYLLMLAFFSLPLVLHGLVFLLLVTLVCPVLVIIGATSGCENRFTYNVSEFLGWISYPLYCLHIPVGNFVAIAANEGGQSWLKVMPFSVMASLLTLLVVIVSTKLYEEPLRRYLGKKIKSTGPV